MSRMIEREVKVIIEGEDYQLISNALELARRRIDENKSGLMVDEFHVRDIQAIKEAMDRFWGN